MQRYSQSNTTVNAFFSDSWACCGLCGTAVLIVLAVYAPFIANRIPLLWRDEYGIWRWPFLLDFFAPNSNEYVVDAVFNYIAISFPVLFFIRMFIKKFCLYVKFFIYVSICVLLILPFVFVQRKIDQVEYRKICKQYDNVYVFPLITYSPNETAGQPYENFSSEHLLGTDTIGRDVASRLIHGSRISLACGIGAGVLALVIGTVIGLAAGFFRKNFDLLVMRIVEILLCFPTFLLLLILMSMLNDMHFNQSLPTVIGVIGFTGWIGLALQARGETLKQIAMSYTLGATSAGISNIRIMLIQLLPNITVPILISFTFGVAGAILAESGLAFLGFGVQPPTASWGELLRQGFEDPLTYHRLVFFPGLFLFWTVFCINLIGEGIRKALNVVNRASL